MAQQLREDVIGGSNHKYMAHQVALLYVRMCADERTSARLSNLMVLCVLALQQCLSQLKTPLGESFKKRIEPNFDAIKALTENDPPMLDVARRQWSPLQPSAPSIAFVESAARGRHR
eukprot:SAG11_NODE_1534_length_4732_cov_1.778545_3_plen_117_part_00